MLFLYNKFLKWGYQVEFELVIFLAFLPQPCSSKLPWSNWHSVLFLKLVLDISQNSTKFLRNSWYLFGRPWKDERMNWPWFHPVVLNLEKCFVEFLKIWILCKICASSLILLSALWKQKMKSYNIFMAVVFSEFTFL